MVASTANTLVLELFHLFPNISKERAPYIARELERHDEADVRQAIREYVDHADDRFLELGRLLAIASRIGKQRHEREALKRREHFKQMETGREATLEKLWREAGEFIAGLSDDELDMLKADVLAMFKPEARALLAKRDPRKNPILTGAIYEHATGKRVAV